MSQEQKIQKGRILARVDTVTGWAKTNPQLLNREIGYERETGKYKIGDGIKTWNELPYASAGLDDNTIHIDENGNAWFAGGILLSSPNGKTWKITVDNNGQLQTSEFTEY